MGPGLSSKSFLICADPDPQTVVDMFRKKFVFVYNETTELKRNSIKIVLTSVAELEPGAGADFFLVGAGSRSRTF